MNSVLVYYVNGCSLTPRILFPKNDRPTFAIYSPQRPGSFGLNINIFLSPCHSYRWLYLELPRYVEIRWMCVFKRTKLIGKKFTHFPRIYYKLYIYIYMYARRQKWLTQNCSSLTLARKRKFCAFSCHFSWRIHDDPACRQFRTNKHIFNSHFLHN